MSVILYSTNCPKCKVLEAKLKEKEIEFTTITDVKIMRKLGMLSAPNLAVNDVIMNFKDSVDWLNQQ